MAGYALDLLHSATSAVYIPTPDFQFLNPIAAVGADAEEIKNDPLALGEGILGFIGRSKVGEIINDVLHDPRAITIHGTEVETPNEHLMAVPILLQDKLSGVMAVWRVGQGTDFTQTEFDFLANLAQQAAIAIENARLFQNVTESQGQLSEALRIARIGYFEIDTEDSTQSRLPTSLFSLLSTSADEKAGGYQLSLQATIDKFIVEEDSQIARQDVG